MLNTNIEQLPKTNVTSTTSIKTIKDSSVTEQQLNQIKDLKHQYDGLIDEYKTIKNKIIKYSGSNPYENKNGRLQTNKTDYTIGYVTNKGVFKNYPNWNVINNTSGKNGCPDLKINNMLKDSVLLNLTNGENYKSIGTELLGDNPLMVGTPMIEGQSCGNEGKNVMVNSMLPNDVKSNYIGCYNDISDSDYLGGANNNNFTFETCKNAAMNQGYRYFGLSNVDSVNNKGSCVVKKSFDVKKENGYQVTGKIILWSSNTSGNPGAICNFTNQGSLSIVLNNTTIFNTDIKESTPNNYLGCYIDKSNRSMPLYNNGSQSYNLSSCQQIAKDNNYKYFGLQNSSNGQTAQCGLSNDLNQSREYGVAGNCSKIQDGSYSGGGWSNAIYQTEMPESIYYLILEDDGNMCIYRGSQPSDNQGLIWCSKTNGKQKDKDDNYKTSKGKYGKNWILSGSTLAPGEFIASNDGKIYLIMQPDGNLVLYTSSTSISCKKMYDGNMGGGLNTYALYDNNYSGDVSMLGKIGYVDSDSNLSEYDKSRLEWLNSYIILSDVKSNGETINTYNNISNEECKNKCDGDNNCEGYEYINNNCELKKNINTMSTQIDGTVNIRKKGISKGMLGDKKELINIDSVKWANYHNTGKKVSNDSFNDLSVLTVERKRLDQINGQLNLLTTQINDMTKELMKKNLSINQQHKLNSLAFKENIDNFNKLSNKTNQNMTNIENILNDTELTMNHDNYMYFGWSLLALSLLTITYASLRK